MIAEELVSDPVEFIRRDPGANVATNLVQGIGSQPTGDAHRLDGVGGLDVGSGEARGSGTIHVLGAKDLGRHRSSRRDAPC